MGSPPTSLPALVARRMETWVTGGGARTDRRSLETRGPNATGSRQTKRGDVPQRLKKAGKKKYARGLDNSGNIEGISNAILPLCYPELRQDQRTTVGSTTAWARLHRPQRLEPSSRLSEDMANTRCSNRAQFQRDTTVLAPSSSTLCWRGVRIIEPHRWLGVLFALPFPKILTSGLVEEISPNKLKL